MLGLSTRRILPAFFVGLCVFGIGCENKPSAVANRGQAPRDEDGTGARNDVSDSRDNAFSTEGIGGEGNGRQGILARGGLNPQAAPGVPPDPRDPTTTTMNPGAFRAKPGDPPVPPERAPAAIPESTGRAQRDPIEKRASAAPDAGVESASQIKLEGFPYERKEVFRSVMQTRIEQLDRETNQIRSRVLGNRDVKDPGLMQERIQNIQSRFTIARDRLEDLETVEADAWENYKRTLRDEIAALEDAYQRLNIAAAKEGMTR